MLCVKKNVHALCRFQKLSKGSPKLNAQQFETIPELAGNPFLSRLFQMFDTDRDDQLTQEEFNSAIDYFLKAQAPEDRIRCMHWRHASEYSDLQFTERLRGHVYGIIRALINVLKSINC